MKGRVEQLNKLKEEYRNIEYVAIMVLIFVEELKV